MIAFIGTRTKRCPTCGLDPCIDGTACVGAMIVEDWIPMSHMSDVYAAIDARRWREATEREMRSPRHWNQPPRSPKPGFKKGRNR